MLILGLDIGSSFLKLWVLDLEASQNRVLYTQNCQTPAFIDTSGQEREIPMAQLAANVKEMIDNIIMLYDIKGIVFSSQMHGFELFKHEGEAFTNYISWQDARCGRWKTSAGIIAHLYDIAGAELFKCNGIQLKTNHSLLPLFQFAQEKNTREPMDFTMMGDALIRHLTGETVPVHPTMAASSGLYDLAKQDWNRELIGLLSLDHFHFPKVASARDPVAYYKHNEKKIPLYIPVGDHQAAVLGCGAVDGNIVINIGTGGQICYVDSKLSFSDQYETRPFFSGRYMRSIAQLLSGRALNVIIKFLADAGCSVFGLDIEPDSQLWSKIGKLAEKLYNSASCKPLDISMSFFDQKSGSISNIDSGNFTIGNIFYAAYKKMADNYFEALKQLDLDGKSINTIIGAGGVLRKTPLLQQLLADRFGIPVKLSPDSEDVMLGLLRLGQWHMRIIPDIL